MVRQQSFCGRSRVRGRCKLLPRRSTLGHAHSTSWVGRSIPWVFGSCSRARCRDLSSSEWRRPCGVSSSRRVCRGRSSSVIRAVQKCLTPSKRLLGCRKGPCVTSEKFSATMEICRRRPFCSFSNMLCGVAYAGLLCFRRWAPASLRIFWRSRRSMGEGAWLVAFLIAQRLVELCFAQRNTRRLRSMGGIEFGSAHYPLIVILHATWIVGLFIFGHDRAIDPFWLAVFIALQIGRLWVIASLGRRWTTRVIVLPGVVPVARGPYRRLRHPNYLSGG